MASNIENFRNSYKKASLNVLGLSEKTVRGVALELFSAIVLTTPVDTGRLRGNWQTSIENPSYGTLNRTDKTGSAAINEIETNAKIYKLNQTMYFTNNLDYAYTIEYGRKGGLVGSLQAPQGMVRINVARFQEVVNKIARENKE